MSAASKSKHPASTLVRQGAAPTHLELQLALRVLQRLGVLEAVLDDVRPAPTYRRRSTLRLDGMSYTSAVQTRVRPCQYVRQGQPMASGMASG